MLNSLPPLPEPFCVDPFAYPDTAWRFTVEQMQNYAIAAIKHATGENQQMLHLAERITASACPEEDGRLEVAYAIARYLKLDWPSACSSERQMTERTYGDDHVTLKLIDAQVSKHSEVFGDIVIDLAAHIRELQAEVARLKAHCADIERQLAAESPEDISDLIDQELAK